MSVATELQPERRPCRHAQIAQSHLLVDDVEVVVEALRLGSDAGTSHGYTAPRLDSTRVARRTRT
jgi:hypothetical protein